MLGFEVIVTDEPLHTSDASALIETVGLLFIVIDNWLVTSSHNDDELVVLTENGKVPVSVGIPLIVKVCPSILYVTPFGKVPFTIMPVAAPS